MYTLEELPFSVQCGALCKNPPAEPSRSAQIQEGSVQPSQCRSRPLHPAYCILHGAPLLLGRVVMDRGAPLCVWIVTLQALFIVWEMGAGGKGVMVLGTKDAVMVLGTMGARRRLRNQVRWVSWSLIGVCVCVREERGSLVDCGSGALASVRPVSCWTRRMHPGARRSGWALRRWRTLSVNALTSHTHTHTYTLTYTHTRPVLHAPHVNRGPAESRRRLVSVSLPRPPPPRAPTSAEDARAPTSSEDARAPTSAEDARAPTSAEDARAPTSAEDARAPTSGTAVTQRRPGPVELGPFSGSKVERS